MDTSWGDWSEWQRDDANHRMWRARQNIAGQFEYDYDSLRDEPNNLGEALGNLTLGDQQDAASTYDDSYTYGALPTSGDAVAASEHGVDPLARAQAAYPADGSDQYSSGYEAGNADPFYSKFSAPSEYMPRSDSAQQSASVNSRYYHGTATVSPFAPGHNADWPAGYPEASSSAPGRQSRRGHASDRRAGLPESAPTEGPPPEGSGSNSHAAASNDAFPDMAILQGALRHATPYLTGGVTESRSAETSQDSRHWQPQDTANLLHAREDDVETLRSSVSYGLQTTGPSLTGHYRSANMANASQFAGFTVEPSNRFTPGKVFKTKWLEQLGATSSASVYTSNTVVCDADGNYFYQSDRRFIVVANDEGFCTCVPILTYRGQACTKRGIKPRMHGIVYSAGREPTLLRGEPELGFRPVRVDMTERTEQLTDSSRVNYAKPQSVEHNLPVLFIGIVDRQHFRDIVAPAYNTCWNRKDRRNR